MNINDSQIEEALKAVLAVNQEPTADLLSRIILVIERRQRLYARVKAVSSLAGLVVSFGLLFLVTGELGRQLAQSGTLRLLSLAFSDTLVIIANWQTFALSILESLPIWPIILVSGGVLIALASLKFLLENLPAANLRLTFNINH